MQIAGLLIYFAVGLAQFFATIAGVGAALGTPAFVNVIIASFLAWLPLIGTIAGIYGAVTAWGWTQMLQPEQMLQLQKHRSRISLRLNGFNTSSKISAQAI